MKILILLFFILLLEGMVCFLFKEHDNKKLHSSSPQAVESTDSGSKFRCQNRIKAYAMSWLNSFVFLSFKVCGYIPSHFIRKILYRYVYHMSIGKDVTIYYGLEARAPWNIKIGQGSIIGDHAILDARYGIEIGTNVNISTGVWMWTLQHDVNSEIFGTEGQGGDISRR